MGILADITYGNGYGLASGFDSRYVHQFWAVSVVHISFAGSSPAPSTIITRLIMYKTYTDEEEKRLWEAINNPNGEEYAGQHNPERRVLKDKGYSEKDYPELVDTEEFGGTN